MEVIDTQLRLLAGDTWNVDGVGTLYVPTLREIVHVEFTRYTQYVNLLMLDAHDAINPEDESTEAEALRKLIDEGDIKAFDIIFRSMDSTIADTYIEAVKLFFRVEKVYYSSEHHLLYLEYNGVTSSAHVIDRDNYERVKEIVGFVSCRNDPSADVDDDENPADERAAAIQAKIRESREIIREAKRNSGEDGGLSMFDIISAVSTRSNCLNKITVWDLTLYQLFDEFKRLQSVDQYETGILAMLQIGDKAKFTHWATGYEGNDE
jgi:hypothetical protein